LLGFLDIFREVEAFDYKCEAFIKITRPFEDIFTEIEALIRNLRLFQRTRGFFKLFPDKWIFFSLIWHIFGGFCLEM
jgi:hypothetical protein